MYLPANLKSIRINWTGPKEVELVISLEKVPISTLGLLLDLQIGPINLEIRQIQGALFDRGEKEKVGVPEAFR